MTGLIVFFIIVFLLALGFSWLADQPDSLLILKFGNFQFAEENLAIIAAIAFVILLTIILVWIIITMVWKAPNTIGLFFRKKRREKGWQALAAGMIAVGAGDVGLAKKSARLSARFLPEEPVIGLLSAQAAQMEGRSDVARGTFQKMLDKSETELLGLRGLYMEAEAAGEEEAARHFVEKAFKKQPGIEWSGKALLQMQVKEEDFESALLTLHQNSDAKLYDKKQAKRLRAVLLTAQAIQEEMGEPQKAKKKALEAHRLAIDLVPAACVAARLLARLGDFRKASKIIEASWKISPHPELMTTYLYLRSGDSGADRLKRAEILNKLRPNHKEGLIGIARAKLDIQDFDGARDALNTLMKVSPTERVCVFMSEVEEAQYGERGRMGEWLSRAVRAPRDEAWTADGLIKAEWIPFSPISGEIDAFEWRVPVKRVDGEVDLHLEDIPDAPIELPVVKSLENKAEEKPAFDIVVQEKTSENSGNENNIIDRDTEYETIAPSIKNEEKTVNEKDIKETEDNLDDASKEVELVFDKPKASDKAEKGVSDPIGRRPIDDPGIKREDEKPKKFKLF